MITYPKTRKFEFNQRINFFTRTDAELTKTGLSRENLQNGSNLCKKMFCRKLKFI